MKTVSLLCLFAALSPGAQVIMGGLASRGEFRFRYETRVEPELPGQNLTGFGAGGIIVEHAFHRYMLDSGSKRYFGYDLAAEPAPGGAYRLSIRPLSLSAGKVGVKGDWREIPLPSLPPPQTVRAGDTVALDLFVHPGTGQKLVDYLFIQDERDPGFRLATGAPRDFTIADVPLTLRKPRFSVNGRRVQEVGASLSGPLMSFYLPGHGRLRFALAPVEREGGFTRAGEVRGDVATIKSGSDTYVVECAGPVAPGGGVFHLYVKHEPAWRPRGPDEFHIGATSY